MIKEEFKKIKSSPKDLRNFGLLVGAVFAALGILFFFLGRGADIVFLVIGAILLFFGTMAPRALYLPYRFWMGFAVIMGWFMSRLILTILFYLVITPLGLLARAVGKDFLGLRKTGGTNSYCQKRDEKLKEQYERQ